MKIALVMKDYDINKSGAERYLAGIVSEMAKEGVSVDLIAARFKGRIPDGVVKRPVKALMKSSILKPITFNWAVQRLLKKLHYDIVYGLTQIYPQDVYRAGGGVEHSWYKIKYPRWWMRIINYIRPRIAVRLYMENQIFKSSNFRMIITNSLFCKYQILANYKILPENITVIYNGVDKTRFFPETRTLYRKTVRDKLGIPDSAKVILFISNNWRKKGLAELIKAVSRLNKPIWLIAAGKGKRAGYIRLAKSLNVSERILFVKHSVEPWQYYGTADLCALPTYYDPCSNVALEALACGLPVITTRANGAREFIIEGENGYLIDRPQDIRKMAKDIYSVLFENNIERMREKAADSVKHLTIKENVRKTLNVFSGLYPKGRVFSPNNLLVKNSYRDFFREQGWDSAENIMAVSSGILYKRNRFRSVVKIPANGKNLFLKRHFNTSQSLWAEREWHNIYRLNAVGIPTMTPAAFGTGRTGSFLFTESLEPAQSLKDFISSYFIRPLDNKRFSEKLRLTARLAELAKRLHQNNLFHKDFYTGHIFIERLGGNFKLYLIDVQRVCEYTQFQNRWQVKDLASLNFSCENTAVTNADKMRFFKLYLGIDKLNVKEKAFAYKIISKTKRISRHTYKKLRLGR